MAITYELFFQILNTILWIGILFLGYKLVCYVSDLLCRIVKK